MCLFLWVWSREHVSAGPAPCMSDRTTTHTAGFPEVFLVMQISAVCLVQESRNAAHAEHVYLYKAVWDPDGCDSVWSACVCVGLVF